MWRSRREGCHGDIGKANRSDVVQDVLLFLKASRQEWSGQQARMYGFRFPSGM